MSTLPRGRPGTVSKILWHFTGGPHWDDRLNKQKTSPKPATRAYRNLKSILRTRELRLGTYHEIVTVIVTERRRFNVAKRETETQRNVPVKLESARVCCLSDIPAAHLGYHAYRYGQFAIGFHREAVLAHGFNPVFYTLGHTKVLHSAYEGLTELSFVDPITMVHAADNIERTLGDLPEDAAGNISEAVLDIRSEAKFVSISMRKAQEGFKEFLAFVKTFSENEFDTIYCEREWRSLQPYKFSMDEVAMIVVPKQVRGRRYFEDFVTRVMPKARVPPTVPIVPWEDLIEH